MDAKQQKTFVGIILIVLLGAVACCGFTVALGAFVGYRESQELAFAGPDAGSRKAAPTPTTDPGEDAFSQEEALRQRFADEILAGLADAGRADYVYDPDSYDLVADGGALISLEKLLKMKACVASNPPSR